MSIQIRSASNRLAGISLSRDNILYIFEMMIDPIVAIVTLFALAYTIENEIEPAYFVLSIIVFFLTFPGKHKIDLSIPSLVVKSSLIWLMIGFLLIILGWATTYIYYFSKEILIKWLILTPILQILSLILLKKLAPFVIQLQGPAKRTVIVGINKRSLNLAAKLNDSHYHAVTFLGFFEERSHERLPEGFDGKILGDNEALTQFVKENQVNTIYLSLPMARQPRILELLDALKDTTASVYFIPDMFMTDLIHSKIEEIDGMPIVAVRETPFTGINGIVKRSADIVFSMGILIAILPILLIIGLGVKLTSPGPIIFKQKRYGLDGEEIKVYKFRSMSTCDNGANIAQATINDQRITKFGAFLRRTSLDELPQFINVLQGRMSVVGPRPHAVSHNEMYRKLIKGYMIRHKVKPGITGWAQVNGLRGETETLDKMQARIDYDIEYVRNWSPKLDSYIILKTIWVVFFKGQNSAY